MSAAPCLATICAFAIAPALAAPIPTGDPFYVRHGQSVQLAHGVKLKVIDVRDERCPAQVTFLRVADTASGPPKAFANRDAALAAAVHYVTAYAGAAKEVCADWRQRQLTSYAEESSGLCRMIGKASPTVHALREDSDTWRFFFPIDDPEMRTQENESLYLLVAVPKAPKDASDQVRGADVAILP